MGAPNGSAGGSWWARIGRLLLLLAAVEYFFDAILDVSVSRTFLYTPMYNATQTTNRSVDHPNWTKPLSLIARITDRIRKYTNDFRKNGTELVRPLCDSIPPGLGPIQANKTDIELYQLEKKYPEVQWGGRYSPPNCTARQKVAIIVPYRDRPQHLRIFLNHMHPFLMKQQIEYGIFIVEQKGTKDFNRAKLLNVGYVESQKQKAGGWQCFIFHDIDLLPLDQRNLYSCAKQPRHMSVSIDVLNFKLPYAYIFGGVSALTAEQFQKVNGFPNRYWGWGGEDDDMSYRVRTVYNHIARYNISIARYTMLAHKEAIAGATRAYCTSLYPGALWASCSQRSLSSLRVQYNNASRVLLGLPRLCSSNTMFAEARVDSFKTSHAWPSGHVVGICWLYRQRAPYCATAQKLTTCPHPKDAECSTGISTRV